MSLSIEVLNSDIPNNYTKINLPDEKLEEYRNNPKALVDFAKSLVAKYEPGEKQGESYRIMEGLKFYLNVLEEDKALKEIMQDFILHGVYEPETTKVVKEYVKKGDICLDAGSSIGYFTNLMARQVGEKGKIYAFEPTQNQCKYLMKNVEANGFSNVELYPQALWSKEGVININGNAEQRDNVKAITLDSLEITYLDFAKIDIDGSEPEALKGMIKTIERSPNLKMAIEFYPEYQKKLGNKPEEMTEILSRYFNCEKIEGDYTDNYYNLYCVRK